MSSTFLWNDLCFSSLFRSKLSWNKTLPPKKMNQPNNPQKTPQPTLQTPKAKEAR